MLARLILVLLLAAFASPGPAAACHSPPDKVMAAMHHAMPAHAPDKGSAAHGCIGCGCIPPADLNQSRVTPRLPPAIFKPWQDVATLDVRPVGPPTPPPPRRV